MDTIALDRQCGSSAPGFNLVLGPDKYTRLHEPNLMGLPFCNGDRRGRHSSNNPYSSNNGSSESVRSNHFHSNMNVLFSLFNVWPLH